MRPIHWSSGQHLGLLTKKSIPDTLDIYIIEYFLDWKIVDLIKKLNIKYTFYKHWYV
jgi:hypothetical protein